MNKNLQIRNSTAEFLTFVLDGKEDGVQVLYKDETIWATQKAMSILFDCSTDNVGLHLKNIFNSNELDVNSTTEKISVVQTEGDREVNRTMTFYNLDAVISVGYRVNSLRATQFRQWTTNIIRQVVKYSNSHSIEAFTKMRADRPRLMKFLKWTGVGGNSENRMFEDIFENVLPQEPKFDAADILCISDFGWETLNTKVTELIAKAKSDGMKFYGLAVGHNSWMGYRHENAFQICDSQWQWIKGQCVNIESTPLIV